MLSSISNQTKAAIKKHLLNKCQDAERGRLYFDSDEEYITTALLESLRISEWQRAGGVKWRLQVHKTGNHGETAESKIGADGIIQIAIYGKDGARLETKGLLFQAKKTSYSGKRSKAEEQINQMRSVVGEKGCAVFIYDKDKGFFGKEPSDFDFSDLKSGALGTKLEFFLANDFLDCKIGEKELFYDWRSGRLFTPKNGIVSVDSEDIQNIATLSITGIRSK
jgi:hypothetical protein